ncbi:G/T mismatch-specific thymine DNA glycosylase [Thermoascus aurantiacus ATCC 26904]
MIPPASSIPDPEPVVDVTEDDVPVNKKTSFNGILNKYLHQTSKSEGARNAEGKSLSTTSSPAEVLKRKLEQSEDSDQTGRTTSRSRPTPPTSTTARITRSRSRASTESTLSASSPTKKSRPSRSLRTIDTSSSPPSLLRDTIPPNLILLFVGVNPGLLTGATGFAYAHPSNLFWKLLHSSGITTVRHPPSDTYRLPELYSVGNTNIVERPTRDASMLSRAEMDAGVPVLEAKVASQRPEAVCLVGKSIWEAVWRVRKGRAIKKEEFHYGWQDESENMGAGNGWKGARVFVATTTSGLAAGMSMAEKEAIWSELGRWVVKRREERKAEAAASAPAPHAPAPAVASNQAAADTTASADNAVEVTDNATPPAPASAVS